jgi:hypothetical protein
VRPTSGSAILSGRKLLEYHNSKPTFKVTHV